MAKIRNVPPNELGDSLRAEDHVETDENVLNLRGLVITLFGSVGAMSPDMYQAALETLAKHSGRELNDEFRAEVKEILKTLPCPLD